MPDFEVCIGYRLLAVYRIPACKIISISKITGQVFDLSPLVISKPLAISSLKTKVS